jgi:hypothetical protein
MAISFRTMSKQKRKEKPTTFVTVVPFGERDRGQPRLASPPDCARLTELHGWACSARARSVSAYKCTWTNRGSLIYYCQ